jgi:hypothetical protein
LFTRFSVLQFGATSAETVRQLVEAEEAREMEMEM